ncbi:uncharacterized protein K02A2.6-like [Rhipicephalus sanguineus]|uniref:uncharacterized protein K02A2.6-like n=1 Tax=Rhipicephalus sanguineus TaxID=34632 RepID=UPI001894183A|nr:uncharacterized protein K02A2.6-like [Rhipicephalus sanguineus]
MPSDNASGEGASGAKPSVSNVFMGRLGNIEEFSPDNAAAWPTYLERLQFYFTSTGVVEEQQQRAVLCSVCGPATYAILRTLCSPATPAETPYADIVSKLTHHFTPTPSVIVQRFTFHKRCQQPGESIADFVADLRRLSKHCEFGVTLEDMLRDRLVCGVRDEGLQRRLLAETALDFKKAYEKAVAAEYATRQTETIRGALPTASELHRMGQAPKADKPGGKQERSKESRTGRCSRCSGDHDATNCGFRSAVCHFCKRKGHIVRACRQKEEARSKATSGNKRPGNLGHSGVYGLYHIASGLPAFMANVIVNGHQVSMEVDSGSVCSIVNLRTLSKLGISKKALRPSSKGVRTYTQQPVCVVGEVEVPVKYNSREGKLPLLVTKGSGISILGRDWFRPLGITLEGLHQLSGAPASKSSSREVQPAARNPSKVVTSVKNLLQDYPDVFKPGLGKTRGLPVRILVDEQATPKFHKPRQVPFALLPKVEEAIEQLVEQGIYVPIKHSRWATPIVPILKKNGKMRICGDYKGTLNPVVKWETYPLPTPEQLLARVGGCAVFSRLDLDQAYQQLCVDEDTAMLQTVTSHKGLFKVTRLQFGVAVAVAIFQRYMEGLLNGLEGVQCFLDDILIGGRTVAEHDERLRKMLQRIQDDGLRLNAEKCAFRDKEVTYLGYRVNKDGVSPLREKVEAIKQAPEPKNKKELQSFLGALKFYGRFLKGASHVLEPLHRLLDKDKAWSWTETEAKAYQDAKSLLESSAVLAHYDVTRPIRLACDASPCGLGAVLSQVPEEFRPLVARKNELSTYRNCVLWGSRVVIPSSAQAQVLDILHTTHPGVVRMKGLARRTVWWPGIDNHIERKVPGCQATLCMHGTIKVAPSGSPGPLLQSPDPFLTKFVCPTVAYGEDTSISSATRPAHWTSVKLTVILVETQPMVMTSL